MSHKIYHINCGTLCMMGGRLLTGKGKFFEKAEMSCHCLLIETNDGLVLVDTGIGHKDCCSPTFPDSLFLKHLMGAKMLSEETALAHIKRLGFSASDVRHIVLTHLDPDHAGGLMDFPDAQVHVFGKELEAALNPVTLWEKTRYRRYLWKHAPRWQTHAYHGEQWHGFESVQVLNDALFDILLVPLQGHTRGHCGVAVSTETGWLLHCGDAYFHHSEVSVNPEEKTPFGLHLVQSLDDVCRADRLYNQNRLRDLNRCHGDRIALISSHDQDHFHQCKNIQHVLKKNITQTPVG